MTRIWAVTQKTTGDRKTYFSTYGAAVKSINKTFPHEFPDELQVTDKTRIGFAPHSGEWVQLEAIFVHADPCYCLIKAN